MGALVEDTDVAGSLVMFDLAKSPARPSRDWFYDGDGIWSVGVNGDSPFDQGDLAQLKAAGPHRSQLTAVTASGGTGRGDVPRAVPEQHRYAETT